MQASSARTALCGRRQGWPDHGPAGGRNYRPHRKDPGQHYCDLTSKFGAPLYTRIDAPATPAQKAALGRLSPDALKASTLAGEPITNRLTRAPGNNAAIGGLKVTTHSGWFAARPSGTENIYKLYAESFRDQAHLDAIVSEAQEILSNALRSAPSS